MTLPDERYRALLLGRKLLQELTDPGKTPRVPAIVRDRARGVLRHYPLDYELDIIAQACPNYLDKDPWSPYNIAKTIDKNKDTHGN
jgi:hypothetical protein